MKKRQTIREWIRSGNDCSRCPASWSEYSEGCDEWDGGCYADRIDGDGWEPCRMPYLLRWYRSRRTKYFEAHEYDDIGDYMIAEEEKANIAEGVFMDCLKSKYIAGDAICWKNTKTGKYSPVDQECVSREYAWRIRSALEDYDREHRPKTLRGEWAALVKKTWKRLVFSAKSFVCKG